ncbi:uncharacterized protein LOC124264388 [Haliotis rubra]|uniref:uncharacterized protein LOC124264388 n=1 Tax=Haliotis rubra TaxID=36100 RepID=UPI001EE4F7C1|nr:uncharacterized protein LOC124264388 [Haliotis rubra]
MMFGLMCFAVLVGCSVAEQFCPPASWRGERVSAVLSVPKIDNEYEPYRDEGHELVYYDASQQKIAVVSNYTGGTGNGDIKIILDYPGKKEYEVDLAKNTCKSKDLTDPFKKRCIGDDATFLYDAKIGFSSDGSDTVTAKVYYIEEVYETHTIGEVIAITSDSYVPIQSTRLGRKGDEFLDQTFTGNVVSPIPDADADIFTPPDSCSSSGVPN